MVQVTKIYVLTDGIKGTTVKNYKVANDELKRMLRDEDAEDPIDIAFEPERGNRFDAYAMFALLEVYGCCERLGRISIDYSPIIGPRFHSGQLQMRATNPVRTGGDTLGGMLTVELHITAEDDEEFNELDSLLRAAILRNTPAQLSKNDEEETATSQRTAKREVASDVDAVVVVMRQKVIALKRTETQVNWNECDDVVFVKHQKVAPSVIDLT